MKDYNKFESLGNVNASENDPRSTVTSFHSRQYFAFTKRVNLNANKSTSRVPNYGLEPYKSLNIKKNNQSKKRCKKIRPPTANMNMQRFKSFVHNSESLKEMKKQIMDDNNYSVNLMFKAKAY